MTPAQLHLRRLSVVEVLKELEGAKLGLSEVSYSEVFARLKQWRLLFYEVDFTTANSVSELEMFDQHYRSMRELLQWRVDALQKPAMVAVATLRKKAAVGPVSQVDLDEGMRELEQAFQQHVYEHDDLETYMNDLRFLVTREFMRVAHGEQSEAFARYLTPLRRLEELRERNTGKRMAQIAVFKQYKEQLMGGGMHDR